VIDEILLSVLRADIALEFELTCDDFFDGNLLIPAVRTIAGLAARLGHLLNATECTP
jgi:hypothetical protein